MNDAPERERARRGSAIRLLRTLAAPAAAAVRARAAPTACALGLAGLGLGLCLLGMPLWWVGSSLLIGAALCLWHAYRPQLMAAGVALQRERRVLGRTLVPGQALLEVFYVGLLAWVATYMLRDVFRGARPISHDHTVHYFKAWQLYKYFLPNFRLHGFSHRWFAGYPVDYLYPIGTDLWVNLVHYAGLGFLPFNRSYGIAFWLFHVLTGYAGYRLGRSIGGPHVGLITGFLLLTDMSSFRFGGYVYTIVYGVWPQALSLVFALLATARVPQIYERSDFRPVGAFALLMGIAIVTHPIELIYLGMLLLAAVLSGWFTPGIKTAAGTARLLIAYGLSVLVSAGWLLPFIDVRGQTTPMGVWWDSTYELGKNLLRLEAFPGTIGFVLALGVFALVIFLRSRQFVLLLAAFMALIVPALSNSSVIDELHLPALSAAFTKVQWLRMSTMVKPFWFALAGYLAVSLVRHARSLVLSGPAQPTPTSQERSPSAVRSVVYGVVVALLTMPFVVPACQAYFTSHIAKAITTERDRALDSDRAALVDWLKHNLPTHGFYRVCVSTGHNHDLLDIGTEIAAPIYKRGFTPAENFIYKMHTDDPAVLEAVNVRYVIAKKWLPPEDYERLVRFGIYQVYEFKHYDPHPYVITHGEGRIKMLHFEGDRIVLRALPGSHGKLRLNVSYFPRWHAYRDGKPVALWPTALPEAPSSTGFMTVWLQPGVYRFAFEPSALDNASVPLSLLGVLISLWLVFAGRRVPGWRFVGRAVAAVMTRLERLSDPQLRPLRGAFLVLAAVAVLSALIALSLWRPPLALEELDGAAVKRVRFDFLEGLNTAHVEYQYFSRARRCRRLGSRFACRTTDGNVDNDLYVASSPAEIEEYRMVRCIRARPQEASRLNIFYPSVPSGDAIVGYYGVERAGRMMHASRPVDFKVFVDGQSAYEGATVSDNKMHWFKAEVGGPRRNVAVNFIVSAANVQRRYFCFYAQMADLRAATPEESAPKRRPAGDVDDDESH